MKYISIKSQMNAYEATHDLKGFRFYHHKNGIYSFKRRVSKVDWEVIQCSELMLRNGDLTFMINKGITISKDRIKTIEANFRRRTRLRSMRPSTLSNAISH